LNTGPVGGARNPANRVVHDQVPRTRRNRTRRTSRARRTARTRRRDRSPTRTC
jgi:hypothetical protein